MPYYNSYQQSYQPYQQNFQNPMPNYQPQYSMNTMQNPSTGSGILWVQGEIGARAYPVAPGSSLLLMDSEAQNFYIKTADMSGMPTMKKYSYAEVAEEPLKLESHAATDYDTAHLASRDEVKKLQEEIADLKNKLATMEVNARNAQQQPQAMQNQPQQGGIPNAQ